MINRLRRSNYIPLGSGETAGFVVEDRSDRLVLDLGAVKGRRYIDGSNISAKTASFSVSNANAGTTFEFNSSTSLVATLPSSNAQNAGARFTFRVATLTAGAGHRVNPQVGQVIAGNGLTAVSGEGLQCTGATDRAGDTIILESNGAGTWFLVAAQVGTWVKVA